LTTKRIRKFVPKQKRINVGKKPGIAGQNRRGGKIGIVTRAMDKKGRAGRTIFLAAGSG
jgi:hypothetical protein